MEEETNKCQHRLTYLRFHKECRGLALLCEEKCEYGMHSKPIPEHKLISR
jgi:hypothetical protein